MSNIQEKVGDAAGKAGDCGVGKSEVACSGDKGVAGIAERMDVIASCGKKIGVVDHVEGAGIKLTKKDSPDNQHHFVPTGWVDHVDSHVHLKKNSMEATQGWKSDAASCGCG